MLIYGQRLSLTTFLSLFILANIATGYNYPDYLKNLRYAYYEGEWNAMPDLDQLTPVKSGSMEVFDLSPKQKDEGYAFRYTATLEVPADGKYLIWQKGSDSCIVYIDDEIVAVNYGIVSQEFETIRARPRIIETLIYLTAGTHHLKADYMSREQSRSFELRIEGPDLYKVDRLHWLYFGWENDHPKSWSFMGGTVVPGRSQRIQYTIEVDGQTFSPDEFAADRRETINWYLADEYQPSPVSEWDADDIGVKIQHFAYRIADDNATAVYSRVTLLNASASQKKVRLNISAGPQREIPLTRKPTTHDDHYMYYDLEIAAGRTVDLDFVALATGKATVEQLQAAGDFETNYRKMASYYNARIERLTHPAKLPNQDLVNSYKASQIIMWQSIVKVENGDFEMRGSGGNPAGYYQYDRTFSHDVPNMVDQFIREGDYELARSIMESEYYQELGRELEQSYLDAIPKYVIPYAKYLQYSGDTAYFTTEIMDKITTAAHLIHEYRDHDAPEGHTGIMQKSNTLDNRSDYLLVDNFAALHGLAAYAYISDYFGNADETAWAKQEMIDLNDAFNAALDHTMKRRGIDWYMGAFDDDAYFWKSGYDGNWIGTTMMMSTFPWDAWLQGFTLGGTWKEAFDRSIDQALHLRDVSDYNIPQRSWGAWWSHEYGAAYNAAMGLQLLFSERHREKLIGNLEFLLDNQSAPFQWGESFDRGMNDSDWTRPATDLETWALGFKKQALLEINIALASDGSLIIGRGVPARWARKGNVIAWKNVRVGNNKQVDYKLTFKRKFIEIEFSGDEPDGDIIINLPVLVNNIARVTVDRKKIKKWDAQAGKVTVPSSSKSIKIKLKK